ncbi:GNAT family N-acetyltransferase [Parafrankia sp. FMc2]|uniref:GNAT family N-acetyltransferase n=1 Tax=Parafrankia sp. FMc2 TaxID=3233196 RepID=UPI0034D4CEE6
MIREGTPVTISIPTLVTDRLVLRCWQPADLAPYAAMNADAETMRYMDGTIGRESSDRLVTHLIGHWHLYGFGMWALELRESGEFIGRAGLYGPTGWPGVEAAWSIRRDLWGQGLAVEAGQAAVHFARQHLRIDHLVSIIEPDHRASRRVAEKLHFGFVELADVGPWKEQAIYRLDLQEQV